MKLVLPVILFLLITSCQVTESDDNDLNFNVPDDVQLELVTKETVVNAPVNIDFDDQGRIRVVEMTSYMPNIEGTEEETNNNRIKILSDEDGDGYFESSKIFLDDLVLPRSLLHAYGGLVYSEPPNLWHIEVDNDLPGKKTLIDSTYAVDGNVEHKPSCLTLNMDNWIYSSGCNARYRKKNGEWIKEFTVPRGQWGMTKDNVGRLLYNNNATLLYADEVIPNALFNNQYLKLEKNHNQILTKDQRVYPIQATAVNRGYQDGVLDEDQKLINTTSACSPLYYRNSDFQAWNNSAFICIPEINAIKKLSIKDNGTSRTAENNPANSEYLITMDEGFRPVDLKQGPDGNIYIVDMHRGIIQHKAFMTSYLREKILKRKLDTVVDMGRILRMSSKTSEAQELNFDLSSDPMKYLFSDNAFLRDKAQHYIVSGNKNEFAEALKEKLKTESSEINLLHCLWTLEGLEEISQDDLIPLIGKQYLHVSYHALYLLRQMNLSNKEELASKIKNSLTKNNLALDLITAHHSNGLKLFTKDELFEAYRALLIRAQEPDKFIEAIISDNEENQSYLLNAIGNPPESDSTMIKFKEALLAIEERKNKRNPVYYYNQNIDLVDRRTVGMKMYRSFCGPCHGVDGEGIKQLAPSLIDSEKVSQSEDELILITLHGLSGPITTKKGTYEYAGEMTGINGNDELSDADIKDILHFVRNAYTSSPYSIEESRIKELRDRKPANGAAFTEQSLDSILVVLKEE